MPVIAGYPQLANLVKVLVGGGPAEKCGDAPTVIKPTLEQRHMIDIAAFCGIPLWINGNGLESCSTVWRRSHGILSFHLDAQVDDLFLLFAPEAIGIGFCRTPIADLVDC